MKKNIKKVSSLVLLLFLVTVLLNIYTSNFSVASSEKSATEKGAANSAGNKKDTDVVDDTLTENSYTGLTGLRGEYYDNLDFTGIKCISVDSTINFDWKNREPAAGVYRDDYTVRWTGQIEPVITDTYTFTIESHGGIRMWINNTLVVEDWTNHNTDWNSGKIALTAGKKYDIKIEYTESNGVGKIQLYWEYTNQSQQIVPSNQLNPIGVPLEFSSNPSYNSIQVAWNTILSAVSYDIEVDGIVYDNGASTNYLQSNLVPGTKHNYRVRTKRGKIIDCWSPYYSVNTLIAIPQILSPSATENKVDFSWNQIEGAVKYDVEIDGKIVNLALVNSYTDDNLLPGTQHEYRVRAIGADVTGDWSQSLIKWTIPDVPKNLSTSTTGSSITINWDNVTGATGYDVEIYNNSVYVGNVTKYTHGNLNPNTQNAYRVRAKNSSGDGKWSETIAETTLPDIPKGISSSTTSGAIFIEWDAVSGAVGYDVEIDKNLIKSVNESKFIHDGLPSLSEHTYRIRAVGSKGKSEWSSFLTASTLPETPTKVEVKVYFDSLDISWVKVDGANNYELQVNGSVISNISDNKYILKNLTPNTEYSYKIRAGKDNFFSLWSNEYKSTTLLDKITNIQTIPSTNEIKLTWDVKNGSESYSIEIDGQVINEINTTEYVHKNLLPNTEHTYRIRSKNSTGFSEWSEKFLCTTMLERPQITSSSSGSSSISITWNAITGATNYEVMADGNVFQVDNVYSFTLNNLSPNSKHIFTVRAKNTKTSSAWSESLVKSTLVGVPQNIMTQANSDTITITWDIVDGAVNYEIYIDKSQVISTSKNEYKLTGLLPNSIHTFSIRASNGDGYSEWSVEKIQMCAPEIPKELKADALPDSIKLYWETVEKAIAYDLEVDGMLVENISELLYIHKNLLPNTKHEYRIRSKNESAKSDWSELFFKNTAPEINIDFARDSVFNFVVVVPKKNGETTRTITVNFNPDEYEVIDLYSSTPKVELAEGIILGTNVKIIAYAGSEIKYEITNATKTTVISLKFRKKSNGQSKIFYTIN